MASKGKTYAEIQAAADDVYDAAREVAARDADSLIREFEEQGYISRVRRSYLVNDAGPPLYHFTAYPGSTEVTYTVEEVLAWGRGYTNALAALRENHRRRSRHGWQVRHHIGRRH